MRASGLIDKCPYGLPLYNFQEVAGGVHIEDYDGKMIFLAEGCSRQVHHLETTVIDLVICNLVKFSCRRVFFGIGSVDTVHAGAF